jgi:SAM-dependent methyltransferase
VSSALQKAGICARYGLRNLRAFVRDALHLRAGESGATHRSFSTAQSVAYVRQAFDDYLAYGGVSKDWLRGKRILEIGPGDNLGVALLFAASGARQVVCLDRFETRADEGRRRLVYEGLRTNLPESEQQLFDEAIDSSSLKLVPEKVRTVIGVPVEEADQALETESFDWIVSRAVLEEVSKAKLARCLEAQHRLLKPGGRMAHKIDLRDYGIFSARGFHPLEYWTLPGWLHSCMSSHEPAPNRCRASGYRAVLERLGYEVDTWITHLAGTEAEIEPHWNDWPVDSRVDLARELATQIRPRLATEFRALEDEDLMTTGVFLVARKSLGG